jgi:bacterial/archaeal transporter family-2 protein
MSSITAATLVALAAGLAGAVQATVLGILGRRTGVMAAAAVVGLIGALVITVMSVVEARGLAGVAGAVRQPAWLWIAGGVLGAVIVTSLTFAPPRIGTFGTFALVIAGNLAAAVLIDSMGLFGVSRVPITVTRLAGLVLLAGGAALVLRR